MKKKQPSKRIRVEFEKEHLNVIVAAVRVYSRLRSGQIGMALDEAYYDRNLSWDEREYLEARVRHIAFPKNYINYMYFLVSFLVVSFRYGAIHYLENINYENTTHT